MYFYNSLKTYASDFIQKNKEGLLKPDALTRLGSLLVIISLYFLIKIFGPNLIWQQNPDEFTYGIKSLFPLLINWPFLFTTLFIGVIIAVLPEKIFKIAFAIIFAMFLITFVEFNFFQGERALIGNDAEGVNIDTSGLWLPILIYMAILAIVIGFRQYLTEWVTLVAGVFILSQSLPILFAPSSNQPKIESNKIQNSEKLSAFSSQENIIHIILDELQSSFMIDVMKKKLPKYKEELSGFTFYRDHLGLYPTTKTGVGYLFVDKVWKNKVPLKEWRKNSLKGNMLRDLVKQKYEVDVVSYPNLTADRSTKHKRIVGIPVPFIGGSSANKIANLQKKAEANLLTGMSLSRALPDYLKSVITKGLGENNILEQAGKGTNYLADRLRANIEFFDEIISLSHVKGSTKRYKLLHFVTTHNPAAVNADCTVSDKFRRGLYVNFIPQAQCSISQLFRFLNKLREIGVYENSTIIVHADHGKRVAQDAPYHLDEHFNNGKKAYSDGLSQIISAALPVLLIKPKAATGEMKTSNAQVWYQDIPSTIRQIANIPLKENQSSILDIQEGINKERFFYHYFYSERDTGFNSRMVKYKVTGPAWKPSSWHKSEELLEPGQTYSKSYIDMGAMESRHYERDYWMQGQAHKVSASYSIGSTASLAYQFKEKRNYNLEINICSTVKNQKVDIFVNNTNIGQIEFGRNPKNFKVYKFAIPASSLPKDLGQLSSIHFKVAKYNTKIPSNYKPQREHGIALDWIKIK